MDFLPLARWSLSLPSVLQTPSLPALQLARSHPGDLVDLCAPGERSSMSRYAVSVQTLFCPNCLQLLFKPLYKEASWQSSENKRCILAPSKWTDKPFLLVFLFHQFCQVYPPDPGKRKSNQVVSGQKGLSFCGNWLKFGVGCWGTHPYTHQSRRPRGSFLSFQANFTPISFSALWTNISLFTLRRVIRWWFSRVKKYTGLF